MSHICMVFRSPVCIHLCTSRCCDWLNLLPQVSHLYGLSPVCIKSWLLIFPLSHESHICMVACFLCVFFGVFEDFVPNYKSFTTPSAPYRAFLQHVIYLPTLPILTSNLCKIEYINVFKMPLKFWASKSPPWEFQKVGKYRYGMHFIDVTCSYKFFSMVCLQCVFSVCTLLGTRRCCNWLNTISNHKHHICMNFLRCIFCDVDRTFLKM